MEDMPNEKRNGFAYPPKDQDDPARWQKFIY
jgi:hypothetical protein